jgi:hypothetical protein
VNNQLVLEQLVLGNDRTTTTWPDELCDGCQQMEKKISGVFHALREKEIAAIATNINSLILLMNY